MLDLEGPVGIEVGGDDPEKEVAVAGHEMALHDLGESCDFSGEVVHGVGVLAGEPHPCISGEALPDLGWIQQSDVAFDDAGVFECPYPAQTGRWGETDCIRKFVVRHPALLLQPAEDVPVGAVEFLRHAVASLCRTGFDVQFILRILVAPFVNSAALSAIVCPRKFGSIAVMPTAPHPIFTTTSNPSPTGVADRQAVLAAPGFGVHFTDHMVTVKWTAETGWHDACVQPFGPLAILPGASALQYAQQVFEGLKAFRHPDGSVWAFRPDRHAARLRGSAARFFLPAPDESLFLDSLRALLAVDHGWVPDADAEKSLYLRPYIIGTEQFLGVRPSQAVTYGVIASPSGQFVGGLTQPADVWLSEQYIRAAPGGTGEAKYGGNYAAGLGPYAEGKAHGCAQTLFVDAESRTWVEEFGGMNVMFVTSDGTLVTPELTGTILHGITRSSLLQLAVEDLGLKVEERRVGVAEWRDRVADGGITEIFACGTAAVITPIGTLKARTFEVPPARNTAGPVTRELRTRLTDLQFGRAEDTRGWMVKLHD